MTLAEETPEFSVLISKTLTCFFLLLDRANFTLRVSFDLSGPPLLDVPRCETCDSEESQNLGKRKRRINTGDQKVEQSCWRNNNIDAGFSQ